MRVEAFSGFSGAGAVLLGEWLGWRHAGACDRDAFCRAVIRHRLPDVPTFDDMAAVPWEAAWSDCSLAAGRVSLTASPASDSRTQTSETDGDLLSTPFAAVDPTSRSSRTSQQSFLATADDIGPDVSQIWPASGTMRNGWCWERTLPAPTIDASACGSSHGVETWPTPCATDSASAANRTAGRSNPDSQHHSGTTLTDAIRLWPTPSASNPNDHESVESFEARRALVREKHYNGNGMGTPLSIAARSWPTPTSSDCVQSRDANKRGNLTLAGATTAATAWPTPTPTRAAAKSQGHYGNGSPTLCSAAVPKGGGVLNPPWVEALMGWPPGWTGLPAEAIARLRREKRSANGKRRAQRPASPVAPKRSGRSGTAGTSRVPCSPGERSSDAPGSDACSKASDA